MSHPQELSFPAGSPQQGDVIGGKYRVERVLGIGGMGMVVAATHMELDELVAVKLLLPQALAASQDATARFVREAKSAIKIKSDHVVRILDTGRLETGAPYIVMEYLDGCDLHALLEREGRLAVDVAVDYVLQACDAIAAAHAMGIVHRDLKPGNLFLTRRSDGSPLVKVLDFGISKVLHGDGVPTSGVTTTSTIMGTPAFMPPEQLRSTRHVDARADIWSMGTILFTLLTGTPPYDGESTADIAAKIIRDAPPPLRTMRPDAPVEIEVAVARCLEKEPDARFPGVAELAEALLPFASERSRASAERIAKQISSRQLGHAQTLRSTPPNPPPNLGPGSASQATRTASAWGETKPADPSKSSRLIRILAGIVGALALGTVVALLVPRGRAGTGIGAGSSVSAPPRASSAPVAAPASPSASALRSAAPPLAPTAISIPTSTSTSTSTPTSPKPSHPSRPHPTKPASAPSSAPSGGLFDDRE